VLERRIESRLVKPAVVVHPPPEPRVEHSGEVLQGFVTAGVQVPAPELSSEVAGGRSTRRRAAVDEGLAPAILRPPGPKCLAQEVEPLVRGGPAPLRILAGDDLRLLRMQLPPTRGTPRLQLLPQARHLRLRPTMAHRIIGIAFERDVRMVPLHPHIERILHEEIRQQGTDYTSYKVAKNVVEFSTSIPREELRPGYGAGCLGAPLTMVKPDDAPTKRERGGRHGTSRPEHVHDAGD
jgi:hypothetical protein